jgi:class 3 adenylate cyclase
MQRHPAPTFVFAKLVGYTSLTDQRGDDAAAELVGEFRRVMCLLARDHGATQVKVAEGDRVASRFVLSGSNGGRRVRMWGIVISRLRDGRIVEDWAAFDGVELLRQLGVWRTLLATPGLLAALRAAKRAQ